MRCPHCGTPSRSRVLDTGPDNNNGIRRRRECNKCHYRFNTIERIVIDLPLVVKGDGSREEFDREKLVRGIRIACAKRPVPAIAIDRLVDNIEERLHNLGRSEVRSRIIGDMVIEGLKTLDAIAHIRYAIVYLGLDSLDSIRKEIDKLINEQVLPPSTPDVATTRGGTT